MEKFGNGGFIMTSNNENSSARNRNLLPYGGFEVAALLNKINSETEEKAAPQLEATEELPVKNTVSSGWLRSKIVAG